MFHNYHYLSRIVIMTHPATAKTREERRNGGGQFDVSRRRKRAAQIRTVIRSHGAATAGTTRFGFGARPLCAYVGGIGSRALNPNLHLSALKRLSNGRTPGRRPLRAHKSDCAHFWITATSSSSEMSPLERYPLPISKFNYAYMLSVRHRYHIGITSRWCSAVRDLRISIKYSLFIYFIYCNYILIFFLFIAISLRIVVTEIY